MIKLKAQDGIFENSIGIGTTNPAVQLNIKNQSTTSNKVQIGFTSQDGTQNAAITHTDEAGEERLALSCGGFNFEHFVLDNNGNVGIGTTNPDVKLDVIGRIKSDSITGNNGLSIASGGTGNLNLYNGIFGSTAELGISIAAAGNVGIGTADPQNKLTVQSDSISNTLTEAVSIIGGNYANSTNAESFKFFHQTQVLNTNRGVAFKSINGLLTIQTIVTSDNSSFANNILLQPDAGNVGIGTTNPNLAKLQIEGSADLLRLTSTRDGAGGAEIILVHDSASPAEGDAVGLINFIGKTSDNTLTTWASIRGIHADFTNKGGDITFLNRLGSNFGESMRITHDGNVGIGTTNPVKTLDVKGTFAISNSATSYWGFDRDDSNGSLRIDDSGVERMCIDIAGNVGIGTASPDLQLDVNGGIQMRGDQFWFKGGAFRFIDRNTGSSLERMRIDSSGNVGIGTTNPSCKLFVDTSDNDFVTKIRNNRGTTAYGILTSLDNASVSTSGGDHLRCATGGIVRLKIFANGDVQNNTNSYGQLSDIKLKENILETTPKLEDLNKVRVVNFNFKGDDLKQIGVVAQELEEIFPGLVYDVQDRDENGNLLETTTKSVKYSVFGPILIKAIQEQQTIIEDLKARIEILENK